MTANSWIRGWDVRSHSDPEKEYRVSLALGGHYGCSCPAWKFSKAPKPDCKHIREIKGNLNRFTAVPVIPRDDVFTHVKVERITTTEYVITELSQADLLAGPLRRKIRKAGE